jgi:4-hydroxy 2-oxovalerate aldolase
MVNTKVSILDCTLRDGGYYNEWQFSDVFVANYLQVMARTDVTILEIGYRHPGEMNAEAYEHYISSVAGNSELDSITLAVMVDAKKFLGCGKVPETLVDALFLPAQQSRISMVRVAIHYKQLDSIKDLVDVFSALGYRVAVNLMQVDMATQEELINQVDAINQMSNIEVLYIADSLGSMNPERVANLFHLFRETCSIPLGFHAHDNKGLALLNTQAAIYEGAEFIDTTLMGMGRGAGNARTEQALPMLLPAPNGLKELQRFLVDYLIPLHRKYHWGDDVTYHFAADNAMHPLYVQEVKQRVTNDMSLVMDILESLAEQECHQFNQQLVDDVINQHSAAAK